MGGFMGNVRCGQVARRNVSIREQLIKKGLISKDFVKYTTLKEALKELS